MKRFLLLFIFMFLFAVSFIETVFGQTPVISPPVTVSPTPNISFEQSVNFDGSASCLKSMKRFDRKITRIKPPNHTLVKNYSPSACQEILDQDLETAMSENCDYIPGNPWDDDSGDNNDRLRKHFQSIYNKDTGICKSAIGTNSAGDYQQEIEIGTDAQLSAIVDNLHCGFSYVEGANLCCKQQNFDDADSDIFSAVPHECLLLGEVCVDELTNLFVGDAINETIDSKKGQADVLKELQREKPQCIVGTPNIGPDMPGVCVCVEDDTQLCSNYISDRDSSQFKQCLTCLKANNEKDQDGNPLHYNMYTALGCIDAKPQGILNFVFSVGIGIAGGVSLMGIIYSSFLLQTSGGKPETIEHSKELLTSFITGLILIIFSIFILRFISVDILRIPGFLE